MKKISTLLTLILLFVPLCSITPAQATPVPQHTTGSTPGDILFLSCYSYPTLSEPVPITVTVQGDAAAPFNETLVISDEFYGLVDAAGEMSWRTGNVTEQQTTITIGRLPRYTEKITWYPTVVGNHTLHIAAGSFPEQTINVSVSFDTNGIITPSLGHPCIISKDTTNELQVTIAETRASTDPPAQILSAALHPINDSTSYPLENQVAVSQRGVNQGPDLLQEELIVTYNISTIPSGFYDITIQTTTQNSTWPHAVKIQDSQPTDYKVVQLTDTHIRKLANLIDEKKELQSLITSINENIHPDFVLLTGDSIDWYNEKYKRNVFEELKEVLLTCDVPVFTTPGNHERYGNSLLFLYYPFTNLTGYHRFLNPLSDSSFAYGDVNYVLLDSGYDYSRWEIQPQIWNTTPEGSGLTNTQMYLLENVWGNAAMDQIIAMHHPAVNDKNDTGPGAVPNNLPSGNDECIAFNRGAFIDYCTTSNVSLVLEGHTHESHVFNALGVTPVNATAWPLFIQTRSSTLSGADDGGRVLHIQNGIVLSYDYVPFE
jgi:predicted MPP superfamily phosphohydrolase